MLKANDPALKMVVRIAYLSIKNPSSSDYLPKILQKQSSIYPSYHLSNWDLGNIGNVEVPICMKLSNVTMSGLTNAMVSQSPEVQSSSHSQQKGKVGFDACYRCHRVGGHLD